MNDVKKLTDTDKTIAQLGGGIAAGFAHGLGKDQSDKDEAGAKSKTDLKPSGGWTNPASTGTSRRPIPKGTGNDPM